MHPCNGNRTPGQSNLCTHEAFVPALGKLEMKLFRHRSRSVDVGATPITGKILVTSTVLHEFLHQPAHSGGYLFQGHRLLVKTGQPFTGH